MGGVNREERHPSRPPARCNGARRRYSPRRRSTGTATRGPAEPARRPARSASQRHIHTSGNAHAEPGSQSFRPHKGGERSPRHAPPRPGDDDRGLTICWLMVLLASRIYYGLSRAVSPSLLSSLTPESSDNHRQPEKEGVRIKRKKRDEETLKESDVHTNITQQPLQRSSPILLYPPLSSSFYPALRSGGEGAVTNGRPRDESSRVEPREKPT
ncbi:hypothetical protein EYF80_048783 [Liparis tanakae]|uniref:Uncharacterized protein n=1 Tax=Liparis tanakae TaxID=230148 RepID=A0A4Z2FIL9_9TELE|nr:hypothetical protein EYF80_048783 [Liparis tanakae]